MSDLLPTLTGRDLAPGRTSPRRQGVPLARPSGVGKTRLAMRSASAVQREYSDGVRLVEWG